MPNLNLGILAHVDAGKTSLTERLLADAGVLETPGSVDEGTTHTDSMDLERRRGITIRAAVSSFDLGDLTVNVLDTPGHPDFIAEVERSLTVLDAAVLVLSAVEGVQPQSVVIWRALREVGVPTILFVNKVDRSGADLYRVLGQVRRRLTADPVLLSVVSAEGTSDASVHSLALSTPSVVESVAGQDDSVLRQWVEHGPPPASSIRRAIRRGVRSGRLTPVLAGSAITGAGVRHLERTLVDLAPRSANACAEAAAGSVFKVDRDGGTRRTWVRLWSGSVAPRDRLHFGGRREVVTDVRVSRHGGLERADRAGAGQVAVLSGLASARVGDAFGPVPDRVVHHFPPPTRQAVVEPVDPTRRTALFTALTELADTDPLIELRVSEDDGEVAVSLHGEVHQEVLGSLLAETYAVPVRFRDLSTVCIERVTGTGEALDVIGVDANPYLATIGLRVHARPAGHGLEFSPGIERGNLPPAFIAATEEGVRAAFSQGLRGWAVSDCLVTMTRSGYLPRQSAMHAGFAKSMSSVGADFRLLGQVVAMAALEDAATRVCEPVERFDLEVPVDVLGAVVALVGTLGGHVEESSGGEGAVRLGGLLASARLPELVRALPDLAGGEAILTHRLHSYVPVRGRPPTRRRHGVDPRDRERWFREMPR